MSEIFVACGVLFSFGNTNNYGSSCLPLAKFYLPLCNVNTQRTQSNIMKYFMMPSWKGLIEQACVKHYSLTQDHLYFLCTIYVVHLQVHPPRQCLCSSTCCLCPEFLATSANRIWIHFRERQTSKEGLRLCYCQQEIGSSVDSVLGYSRNNTSFPAVMFGYSRTQTQLMLLCVPLLSCSCLRGCGCQVLFSCSPNLFSYPNLCSESRKIQPPQRPPPANSASSSSQT